VITIAPFCIPEKRLSPRHHHQRIPQHEVRKPDAVLLESPHQAVKVIAQH
jgi:hypothetical protein